MLGIDTTTGEEVSLPSDNLHTYIIGNTGMGKTTLERGMIADTIAKGYGVCVLDPHGERKGCLVDLVLADLPKEREKDVILFDINNTHLVPGLKPFYCRDPQDPIAVQDTISTALNIFEKVYNVDRNTMARIIAYIESLIYVFIFNPDLTLLDIPTLLNPDSKYDRKRLEAVSHLPESPGYNFTRAFWTEEFSRRAKRGTYNQDSEIFGTLMKFRELSNHLIWPMFCQKTNTLDMRRIMAARKILIVKLNGNWEDITSLVGTYLIGQIKDASFSRSLSDPPFYLYVDEFQRMASRDFLTLFSEARGGGVHICVNHQVVSQLDSDIKETIRQASTFICFKVTDISADDVSTMFATTPPPGEWIYEKIMRKAEEAYEVDVWDDADAEREYYLLGEQISNTQALIVVQEKNAHLLPAPAHFPLRMTSQLWNVAEQLMYWLRPYIYDEEVLAYCKSLYKRRYSLSLSGADGGFTKQYTYFVDFQGEYHKREFYWCHERPHPYYYYAIKPHIKPDTAYRFPYHFPCEFEENRDLDPTLKREIQLMYAPFKLHAHYFFDVETYNKALSYGWYDDSDNFFSRHFLNPFKGPYFRTDADWLAILKWFYTKAYAHQTTQQTLQQIHTRQEELYKRYHRVETRRVWKGWYEPEPIMEWDYLAELKAFARDFGEEFMIGDNCKYRARLGPPPYGSDEVARRTANQIKQLKQYHALVQINGQKYEIVTNAPPAVDAATVQKRIAAIYERNRKEGYLRLRSEVEAEMSQTQSLPITASPTQHGALLPKPRRK